MCVWLYSPESLRACVLELFEVTVILLMQHNEWVDSFHCPHNNFSVIPDKPWSHYSFWGKVYIGLPHPAAPICQVALGTYALREGQIWLCCGYVASQSIGKALLGFGTSGLQPGPLEGFGSTVLKKEISGSYWKVQTDKHLVKGVTPQIQCYNRRSLGSCNWDMVIIMNFKW